VLADNLGSLLLGGFKESCSATKMYRIVWPKSQMHELRFDNVHNYVFLLCILMLSS